MLLLHSATLYSQSPLDTVLHTIDVDKLSGSVERRFVKLEEKIHHTIEQTLQRLRLQEEKIYKKLLRTNDSSEARSKLTRLHNSYTSLKETIIHPLSLTPLDIRQYIPHLDSLNAALKFLSHNNATTNLREVVSKIGSVNDKFQYAQSVKDFIYQRKKVLQKELEQLGLVKQLRQINKEFYFYTEQLREYREIISDPCKIENKAIELLSKVDAFRDFMRKNSVLASVFRLPGDLNDRDHIADLSSLQTRVQVNSLIQQQIVPGGPNAQMQFRQEIQQAQSQMQLLKNKFLEYGKGSSDDIMPEGVSPNSQKTRTFLDRLEYGMNIQAQRSTNFFPATVDFGVLVGYKLNGKSTIGVGASCKVGLGQGWNHMNVSSQGAGLRSYLDWKLRGSMWISGGYEINYRSQLQDLQIPSLVGGGEVAAWQQSGLLGLSKVFDVESKVFKKTRLQLLWDFLSYHQLPRTQPIIFRIGYTMK